MIDYRTISPIKITDPNDNVSEVLTDELGMVIVTSIHGDEDGLTKGDKPLSSYQPIANSLQQILASPHDYLQEATSFFYYDLTA